MSPVPERLKGPLSKVARAEQHIRHLDVLARAFCDANRNAFRVEDDLETSEKVYRVEYRTPISPELSLVIGDALHNLRSALDHLAWQLVEANGGTPGRQTNFPVFSDATKYSAGSSRAVQGMSTAAVSLIEAVQPYQAGYDGIGILSELDNFDKHRLLLIVAHRLADSAYGFLGDLAKRVSEGKPFSFEWTVMPSRTSVLKNGDEFCRVSAEQYVDPNNHVEFTVQVAISNAALGEAVTAVPFLSQLSQLIKGVINQFAPFV